MADNIELMHSYSEFPNDAIEAFQNLINKYNLRPTVHGICSIIFDNKFCRLNFNMDRYDLQGQLFRKQVSPYKEIDEFSFSISAIANLLCPDHNLADTFPKTTYGDKKSIRHFLFWYANLIEGCLTTVLSGNFNWYDKLKKDNLYQRKLIGVMLGKHIDYEHPISKKFRSGDNSWRQDIEKFIRDNDIQLE